jgi:hypothetical protein
VSVIEFVADRLQPPPFELGYLQGWPTLGGADQSGVQ